MSALLLGSLRSGGHQVHLSVLDGGNDNHALAQLLLELIAQVSQTVHVNAVHPDCQELHAVYLLYLV